MEVAGRVEVPLRGEEIAATERAVEPLVEPLRAVEPQEQRLLVEPRTFLEQRHVLAREIAAHEIGRPVVLERDVVAARTVERVRERGRLADQRPALARVGEPRRAVGELAEGHRVDRLGLLHQARDGGVRAQERVQAGLAPELGSELFLPHHDAHARHAASQRDEPDPVPRITEMVRREDARGVSHARVEGLGPDVVEIGHAAVASPGGGVRERRLGAQTALLRDHARASRRVDDPTRLDRTGGAPVLFERDDVRIAERHARDAHPDPDVHAARHVHREHVGLEPRAIDLERRERDEPRGPDLAQGVERARLVLAVEEEAQAVLR